MKKVGMSATHIAIAIILFVAALSLIERSVEQPLKDINATNAALFAKV